jgi:hypothetical protein
MDMFNLLLTNFFFQGGEAFSDSSERDSSVTLGTDAGIVGVFFKAAATCDSPLPGDIICSNTLPVQSTGALVSQFKTGTNVFL